MGGRELTVTVCFALAAVATGPACADIFTWVDKNGVTNVSNEPPPEGVRVTKVVRSAPKDAAREAAARTAEMRALRDRVEDLTKEVEQTRHDAMPPPYAPAPAMAYAPPPAAPTVVVTVINQPAQPEPAPAACDLGYGCGLGFFPGYTYYAPVAPYQRGFHKPYRRWAGTPMRQGSLIPPLIPYPATHSSPGRRLG
jgi:Domain of unknown function (DUF4124)